MYGNQRGLTLWVTLTRVARPMCVCAATQDMIRLRSSLCLDIIISNRSIEATECSACKARAELVLSSMADTNRQQ